MSESQIPGRSGAKIAALLFFGRPRIYAAESAHIVHLFESEKERLAVVAPFIKTGLAANHQCLMIAEPPKYSMIERHLKRSGVDVKSALASGQLVVSISISQASENPSMFEEVSSCGDRPRRTVIRITSDMTAVLGKIATAEDVLEWEGLYGRHVGPHVNLVVLCQYNNPRSTGEAVLCALHTHPLSIIDRFVQENPFHLSRHSQGPPSPVAIPCSERT